MRKTLMFRRMICCVCVLVLQLAAQSVQEAGGTIDSGFPALNASRGYQIGPNDLLGIEVFGVEELDQVTRVSSSGLISIPYLGRVLAVGLTGSELEEKIERGLVEQELVRDPQVSVFIQEYNSQPIYVLGAVNQPGQYMITHQLSVIDAITMAGGLDREKAGKYILVRRGKGPFETVSDGNGEDKQPVFRIDLKALLEDGDIRQDIPLRGGDVVQVPLRKVEMYYVIGEVPRPGAFEFPMQEKSDLLATRAIGSAGGPAKTAKLKDAVVLRYIDGQRQELPLNLKAVLNGQASDVPVLPNDIIFIPGSKMKTLGWGLLGVLPPTMSGVAIWNSNR